MTTSQRLRGLELLLSIDAPVPSWEVVDRPQDIPRLSDRDARFGWTIRTCRTDGKREMGLFYLNCADSRTAVRVLRERFRGGPRTEFYIVYPSWKFRFSCNVVFREETYYIEGKYASQKELAIGRAGPDFGLIVPLGIRSKMTCYLGTPSDEVMAWLGRILWWCRRVPMDSFYAEVALIHTSSLMFYELFAI
jgi:hypothetical protein